MYLFKDKFVPAAQNLDGLMSRQRTFTFNERAKRLICCNVSNAARRMVGVWTTVGAVAMSFAILLGYKVVTNLVPSTKWDSNHMQGFVPPFFYSCGSISGRKSDLPPEETMKKHEASEEEKLVEAEEAVMQESADYVNLEARSPPARSPRDHLYVETDIPLGLGDAKGALYKAFRASLCG